MAKLLLSIGLIVKNEIRCMERCLKALQPLREAVPCEVIVADTGSEDGTREIAEKYADVVFDFPWINDFAAARNAVMDRCSGSWYLSLDADETMDPNVEELKAFLNSPKAKECTSAYLLINNYIDPNDKSQYVTFEANRLLNMSTGLRFKGRVHEVWPSTALSNYIYLRKTVLWHDGYIQNGFLTNNVKGKRNMALIEQQLADDPHNLLYLMQAVESSYTTEQSIKYVKRMMEELKENGARGTILAPAAYRDALRVSGEVGLPEYQQWLEEALAAYPQSPYIQVDVHYMAAMTAQKKHDYAKVLEYGRLYLEGMERLEKGDFGPDGLRSGTITAGSKSNYEGVILAMAMAHARLREWEACRKLLEEHPVETMSVGNVGKWLNVAYFSWEYIDLTPLFVKAGKALFTSAADDEKVEKRRNAFIARSNEMFFYVPPTDLEPGEFYPEKPAFPLLVALGDCDLAHAARVMLSEEPDEVLTEANRISNWDNIPYLVLVKLLVLHLPMPSGFLEISAEKLIQYVGKLTEKLGNQLADLLPEEEAHSPMERLWQYNLCIGAIRSAAWDDGEKREKLGDLNRRFLEQSRQFLSWYYHPDLLNADTVCVLPGMHRFAWYCCQAEDALDRGDELGYVRCLRAGLEAAPAMKGMVDFLLKRLDERKRRNASPELLALAEKVRSILTQYPPDDPAVAALKRSEAYRKVAYLIEGANTTLFGVLPQ